MVAEPEPKGGLSPRRLRLRRLPPVPRPRLEGPALVDRGPRGDAPPLVLRGRPIPVALSDEPE